MRDEEYLLLVEDDVSLGENIEEVLEDAGHHVVRCLCAEQALKRADLKRCRGIITDFRLPGLSGIELIGELKRRQIGPPSLLVSALMDEQLRQHAAIHGTRQFLTKPVNLPALLDWAEHPR